MLGMFLFGFVRFVLGKGGNARRVPGALLYDLEWAARVSLRKHYYFLTYSRQYTNRPVFDFKI
jgi:hypothetical protein